MSEQIVSAKSQFWATRIEVDYTGQRDVVTNPNAQYVAAPPHAGNLGCPIHFPDCRKVGRKSRRSVRRTSGRCIRWTRRRVSGRTLGWCATR